MLFLKSALQWKNYESFLLKSESQDFFLILDLITFEYDTKMCQYSGIVIVKARALKNRLVVTNTYGVLGFFSSTYFQIIIILQLLGPKTPPLPDFARIENHYVK